MQKDVILTPEGLEKLKQEIEYLSTTKRREVAERIKEAREFGDISENSEYDDAKNEQAMLEARIATLEDKLRSASVIDAKELSADVVRVGSQVHVTDEKGKKLSVHDRRLDRGRPVGQPALQRVAGRQGARRPQEGRRGHGAPAQRQAARAQGHQDRSGMSAEARSLNSSPSAAASSKHCGRRASTRSRTRTRTSRRSLRPRAPTRDSNPARRPTSACASPAACTRAGARARWRSWTSTTAPAGSSSRRAATCSATRSSSACSPPTSAT